MQGEIKAPHHVVRYSRYVGLQPAVPTVGLFANKYTVLNLNHERNITGNYAIRMHKILKH